MSKQDIINSLRRSDEIDVSKEPNFYFALLAYETYGNAIRDNSLKEWIEIGMECE